MLTLSAWILFAGRRTFPAIVDCNGFDILAIAQQGHSGRLKSGIKLGVQPRVWAQLWEKQ